MGEKLSVGQMLRKQREERGLTPEQAAYQSKVPLRLLQALEADDYRLLPDPVYLVGFLHEYAVLLKLDPKVLEADFRNAIRRTPWASLAPLASQAVPLTIPWKQILWTVAAILIVTPLVFIALSLASKRAAEHFAFTQVVGQPEGPAGAAAPAAPGQIPAAGTEGVQAEPTAGPGGVPVPSQTGSESTGRTPEAPVSPPSHAERKPRRFLLMARALEPTWMVVRAEDGQERDVLLQKGQVARFASDAGFIVTVGNAGGVELSLNGKPLPVLGESGQVIRDLTIPPAGQGSEAPGAASPGSAPPGTAPER